MKTFYYNINKNNNLEMANQLKVGDKFKAHLPSNPQWDGGIWLVMEVAGEFWILREGYDTNSAYCYKTQNGNGAKLNKGEMVDIAMASNAAAKFLATSIHNGDIHLYYLNNKSHYYHFVKQ